MFLITALAASACGSSDSSSSTDRPPKTGKLAMCDGSADPHASEFQITRDEELAKQVPAEWRDRTMRVATDAGGAPFEGLDSSNKVYGIDPLVVAATAQLLGLKCKYEVTNYAGIIPALQANKFDLATAQMRDQKARQGAVDFVNFTIQGSVLLVPKGNAQGITGLESMCGKTLVTTRGVDPTTFKPATDDFCKSNGRSALDVKQVPNLGEIVLAVKAKTAAAGWVGTSSAQPLAASSAGAVEVLMPSGRPSGYIPGLTGLAFSKGHPLVPVTTEALKKLYADGTLKKMLEVYDFADLLYSEVVVNKALEAPLLPADAQPNG